MRNPDQREGIRNVTEQGSQHPQTEARDQRHDDRSAEGEHGSQQDAGALELPTGKAKDQRHSIQDAGAGRQRQGP